MLLFSVALEGPWPFLVLAVALGVAALAWLLYGRDRGLVPVAVGRAASTLRVVALLLLAAPFLEAVFRREERETLPSEVLLLLDASSSMARVDAHRSAQQKTDEARAFGAADASVVEGLSRIDLARRVLSAGGAQSPLAELLRSHRVVAVALADAPREVALSVEGALGPIEANGSSTDLGGAVLDAILRRPRETLAAAVLVSDGRHHGSRKPDEVLSVLSTMGVPLIALGVGAEVAPRDFRVVSVETSPRAVSGEAVSLSITVAASGPPSDGPIEVPVEILQGDAVLQAVVAELPAKATHASFALSFVAPAAEGGAESLARFVARVPAQPGEISLEDNARGFAIGLRSAPIAVLALDRGPRWEERYLRAALDRDPGVKLDSYRVTRPPERRLPQEFPRSREALFRYDALILGDVDPSVFTPAEVDLLREFVVEEGRGLICLSGERAMPVSWGETALGPLLPVKVGGARRGADGDRDSARGELRAQLTPAGEEAWPLRLVPGVASNRELWSVLPGHDWHARVEAAHPAAVVLAESLGRGEAAAPGAVPILALREVGAGRVYYSGIDGVWRWRSLAGDAYLSRLWGHAVRWAALERFPSSSGASRVRVERPQFQGRARVGVRALLRSNDGKPVEGARLDAVVRAVSGEAMRRAALSGVPGGFGLYGGEVEVGPVSRSVECEVSLEAAQAESADGLATARARFWLDPEPSLEASDLTRDLAQLAEMARRAGGASVALPLSRAREVPALIAQKQVVRTHTASIEQWRFSWWFFGLAAALLVAEWALRRRFDLA